MRVENNSKRQFIKTIGAGIVFGSAGCLGSGNSSDGNGGSGNNSDNSAHWTEGTASQEGLTYAAGKAFARILDKKNSNVHLQVSPYSGSAEAMRRMGRGDNKLSSGDLLLGVPAYKETAPIEGIDFTGNRALKQSPNQLFAYTAVRAWYDVKADSGIKTAEDLKGKTVSIGPTGGDYFFKAILKTINVLDDVDTVNNPYSDLPKALRQGRIDAIPAYSFAGATPGWHSQLASMDIQIARMTNTQRKQLSKSNLLSPFDEPVGKYYDTDLKSDTTTSAADYHVLWINENAAKDPAYKLTKTVVSNYKTIKKYHSAFAEFNPKTAVKNMSKIVPVHPGAVQYYKEAGHWNDQLTTQ